MPGIVRRPTRRHPQQYLHLSTLAAEEVWLWNIADSSNFTDAHAGGNI